MAVDSTSIKNDIDTNLANKGYRGIRIVNVITALKNVVDWVRDSINANLTTWLRLDNGQPGGGNTDTIYRTGQTYFKGPARFYPGTTNAAALAGLVIGEVTGLQITGNNGGPAFMEFHLPGSLIHQLGVDTDGVLKLHRWATNVASAVLIDGVSGHFALNDDLANRKVVLYGNINDHQFFGLGINSNVLRYQVGGVGASHIFYAGTSPATSKELMRIIGSGRVSIGTNADPATNTALDVEGGWANFHGNIAGANPGNGIGVNFGWNYSAGQAENTLAYGIQNFPGSYLNFCSWNGVVMSEKMRITADGKVGIGTTGPSSRLQVSAPGYEQFRLENGFTPANSSDGNGQQGQIAWDNNYFYVKTAIGWRRSALSSW